MIHELKILPEYLGAIIEGTKTFEIRKNDRNFEVGDLLLLRGWNGEKYTGEETTVEVIYMLDDTSRYILDGYVVMSII